MADPLAIKTALDSLRTASDMVKILRSADASFEKAELKLKIADLAEALASARLAVLDAQEEIEELRTELASLRDQRTEEASVIKRDNVYYIRAGDQERGPFCPRCYEAEGTKMPVSELPPGFRDIARFNCPNCKAHY